MELTKNYQDLQDTINYKKGVEMFKNNKLTKEARIPPEEPAKIFWVKKFVSVKDFNQYYKYDSAYCFLKKVPLKGVWLGFSVANYVPKDCSLMNDEEIRQVDDYRISYHIAPTPFEKVEVNKTHFKETLNTEDKEKFETMFGEEN